MIPIRKADHEMERKGIFAKAKKVNVMENVIASAATGDNKMVIIIIACFAAAALLFVVTRLGKKK